MSAYRRLYARERRQNPFSIPIGVVADHRRMDYAEGLAKKVGAEVVSIDGYGRGGAWNHCQVLNWMKDGGSEWSVILEDDAIPAPTFRTQLEMALDKAPTPFVGLYLGRGRPPHWQAGISAVIAQDVCWLVCDVLQNAVGYAVKTNLIPSMLSSAEECWRYAPGLPIDETITEWGAEYGIRFSYCRPSLVQHRDKAPVQRHGYGLPTEKRRAWLFGYRESWDSSTTFLQYVRTW
jgi:hypothetical protein